jgi:hypothetical protein
MSVPDGVKLLEEFITSSSALKEEDKGVVRSVCDRLRIGDSSAMVNDYFRTQVELEATAVYLTSKYGALMDRWRGLIEKHKAEKYMELGSRNDDGLKWTKEAKEQWLLSTDSRYSVLSDYCLQAERLLYTIRDLSTIVFGRNGKLEQLSINYRREQTADQRSS